VSTLQNTTEFSCRKATVLLSNQPSGIPIHVSSCLATLFHARVSGATVQGPGERSRNTDVKVSAKSEGIPNDPPQLTTILEPSGDHEAPANVPRTWLLESRSNQNHCPVSVLTNATRFLSLPLSRHSVHPNATQVFVWADELDGTDTVTDLQPSLGKKSPGSHRMISWT